MAMEHTFFCGVQAECHGWWWRASDIVCFRILADADLAAIVVRQRQAARKRPWTDQRLTWLLRSAVAVVGASIKKRKIAVFWTEQIFAPFVAE